jgi:Zn-dependent M28 family amino/carboxypeptidase
LVLLVPAWGGNPTSRNTAAYFNPSIYLDHIKYLASDELGGRGTGSEGIDRAADYIAEQFKAIGCEPAGVDGTWFQPFEVKLGKKIAPDQARLEIEGMAAPWQVERDWIPFPFSVPESVEGPLAFAGYGIKAERYDYDDYADFDAEGKVLLILRYEPKDEDPQADFGGETPSRYAFFYQKARTAAKAGAKALLVVNPPNRAPEKDELYAFDLFGSQQTYDLPMVHITREVADAILKKAGMSDLRTVQQQLDEKRASMSRDLGLTIHLNPGIEPNRMPAKNVLGLIRGDGSTEETVVVGAHYDHLGIRPSWTQTSEPKDAIYNGADDNASGTAGVIELARAVKNGPPLRRNVLFITFSGEELGLLGSQHFVSEPTIPLTDIRAMINLDMIGRLSKTPLAIMGIDTATEFPDLVKTAAERAGIEYRGSGGRFGGSDHASFARHEVPVLFFFTGIHKQYHQPEDDWDLINAPGATQVLGLAHDLLVELADLESGPTFAESKEPASAEHGVKRPAIEEERQAAEGEGAPPPTDEQPSRRAMRVRLGIIPDMVGDDQPGMVVQTVLDGACAQAAGLKDGDRIMKIGDDTIRDIYAYMRVLQQFRPGDEVDIVVAREGKELTLKVKLEAAKRRPGDD